MITTQYVEPPGSITIDIELTSDVVDAFEGSPPPVFEFDIDGMPWFVEVVAGTPKFVAIHSFSPFINPWFEPGWVVENITCDPAHFDPTTQPIIGHVECTYTVGLDPETATVTIAKVTEPATENPWFLVELASTLGQQHRAVAHGEQVTVVTGVQLVDFAEVEREGWELTEVDCTGMQSILYREGGRVGLDVGAGDRVNCTLTNVATAEPTPDPTAEPTPDPTPDPTTASGFAEQLDYAPFSSDTAEALRSAPLATMEAPMVVAGSDSSPTTVTAEPESSAALAVTGNESSDIAGLGLLLIGAGSALLFEVRRRR